MGVREDGNFENRRAKRCFDADRYLKGLSNRRPRLIVHRWRIWFCLFFRRSLDFAPPFLFFFFFASLCFCLLMIVIWIFSGKGRRSRRFLFDLIGFLSRMKV